MPPGKLEKAGVADSLEVSTGDPAAMVRAHHVYRMSSIVLGDMLAFLLHPWDWCPSVHTHRNWGSEQLNMISNVTQRWSFQEAE